MPRDAHPRLISGLAGVLALTASLFALSPTTTAMAGDEDDHRHARHADAGAGSCAGDAGGGYVFSDPVAAPVPAVHLAACSASSGRGGCGLFMVAVAAATVLARRRTTQSSPAERGKKP